MMVFRTALWALLLSIIAVFGPLAPVAAQDASPVAVEGELTPVVIDSDMTFDDWMATLFVLNHPGFEVKAITVTGTGFAYCDSGITAALGLLALAEYGDVPVSCWTETPLAGDNAPPADWRTTMDAVKIRGLDVGGEADPRDAVTLFTETVQDSDVPVTVLALGPLTNVGAALEATPDLVGQIEMMYVMGGAVDVDGSFVNETNSSAEWNIYCDPHSARLTFESGVPITLVPLDATNAMPVTSGFVERLKAEMSTPEAEFVASMLDSISESIESGGYYFWDPLAAVVMVDPSLVTLTRRNVTVVDIPGDPDDGRTKPDPNGSEILVATAPDAAAVESALIAVWNS